MRSPALLASLALTLVATTAAASVIQPNGVQMPLDSMNGEIQLYTLFSQLGEPLDWQADAAATPDAFSPLCGFTAQFILHEAGSSFNLAWYNANGVAPQAGDLHVIVPAGSPVGTTITSADIKNDPAYAGGLIGFALVGGQTHYTEVEWNPVCTGCNPAAPWVTALIYPSKNTPNAYYIAFEDGSVGPNPGNFNNDGDYNDDVYFLTGITCSGGGQPCDTGMPGICGPGLTQCTANGVTCNGLSNASPTETCNGLDDDCNGVTDEGEICPAGFVCDKGTCVQSCNGGEFQCLGNLVCNADGYCVDPACKDVMCPSGEVCVDGLCKGPCDGVVCPNPQICLVGACVDPCTGVVCESGQVCDQGVCVTTCDCQPCAAGLACEPSSGLCVEPACVGVTCGAGTHCVGGQCVDACTGAVCPDGQQCEMGQCVAAPASSSSSSSGFGFGGGGSGPGTGGGGGSGPTSSGGNGPGGGGGSGGSGVESKGGCGCTVPGESGAGGELALLGLAIAALCGRGNRRRSR